MAVINRNECLFKCFASIQGIVLFCVLFGAGIALANPKGCDSINKTVNEMGFHQTVLTRPENGLICGEGSCCSGEMERDMLKYSQLYIDKYWRDSITKLYNFFDNRAKKFDEFFRSIMQKSKQEFHDMFKKTYGKIYMDNSDVFSDFFQELERYYKKGTVRLSETLDTFFGILYQRMFVVINSQYTFDDSYLDCVSNHMNELNPFGDVSSKLSLQLRRAFVATKMFYKALQTTSNITMNLLEYKFSDECKREITKMQFCGVCKGESKTPCSNYCSETMRRCFHSFEVSEFNKKWDTLIISIEKVADRLLGPYNVEIVVEPINIKISEAIMNFQETGVEVSKKIYGFCGQPSLNRVQRKAEVNNRPETNPNVELNYEPLKPHKKKQKSHSNNNDLADNSPSLDKIVKEIKMKIHETQKFWLNLPFQYCNNLTDPIAPNATCWSGIGTTSNPKETSISPLINEQIYIINTTVDKLRGAYHGEEVELLDDEMMEGSGSGSGDGRILDSDDEDLNPAPPDQERTEPPVVFSSETPPSTRPPEVVQTSSAGAAGDKMSLSRALVQYVLPIVLAWFGGAITDLL
ncbi:unnamed protein product [Brassicogethes aeneus]|uniref:Glypican-6 n=1 Tax=Brassicogethes aeneus TaxID=1431903 RepID=A0A9P0BA39_BRAAE|nr:unnamed protein product [Brassicogethes aeneus]